MDNIFTKEVILYSIQILDFKTSQDDYIKGYKLFYITEPSEEKKGDYIGGKAESSFIKDENYKEILKSYTNRQFPTKVKIQFELTSLDKPPKPIKIV